MPRNAHFSLLIIRWVLNWLFQVYVYTVVIILFDDWVLRELESKNDLWDLTKLYYSILSISNL